MVIPEIQLCMYSALELWFCVEESRATNFSGVFFLFILALRLAPQ